MTLNEYKRLGVGDIIAHIHIPWGEWIVVNKVARRGEKRDLGWHVVRLTDDGMPGKVEHNRMERPEEWFLKSRVISRELFEAKIK